jgi:hypothetical protein
MKQPQSNVKKVDQERNTETFFFIFIIILKYTILKIFQMNVVYLVRHSTTLYKLGHMNLHISCTIAVSEKFETVRFFWRQIG